MARLSPLVACTGGVHVTFSPHHRNPPNLPPCPQEAAFWLESIPLLDEEAQSAFSYRVATWTLLTLCLLLAVALAVVIAACIARGRKDGYDSDDVISKVLTS